MTTTQNLRTELSYTSCVICHELNPNLATLCCPTPVHLARLNNWTDENPNCMVCRSKLLLNATNNPAVRTTLLSENNSLDIESSEEEEERHDIRYEICIVTHVKDSSSTSSEDNDYPDEESEIDIQEEEEEDY